METFSPLMILQRNSPPNSAATFPSGAHVQVSSGLGGVELFLFEPISGSRLCDLLEPSVRYDLHHHPTTLPIPDPYDIAALLPGSPRPPRSSLDRLGWVIKFIDPVRLASATTNYQGIRALPHPIQALAFRGFTGAVW